MIETIKVMLGAFGMVIYLMCSIFNCVVLGLIQLGNYKMKPWFNKLRSGSKTFQLGLMLMLLILSFTPVVNVFITLIIFFALDNGDSK